MSEGKNVLIAVDGSEAAAHALLWYVTNVHKPEDYVIIVHCAEYLNINYAMVTLMPGDPSLVERTIGEEEKRIHALIEHLENFIVSHQVKGEVVRVAGEPGHAVVEKAEETNASMIVTGSRGRGTVRRTLMGSVSDYIVHHSHIPVLVCKHETQQKHHRHHHSEHTH